MYEKIYCFILLHNITGIPQCKNEKKTEVSKNQKSILKHICSHIFAFVYALLRYTGSQREVTLRYTGYTNQ